MKLKTWIALRPEVDEKIKEVVAASLAFRRHVQGFSIASMTDEKIEPWKKEHQRLFGIFDRLQKEAEALMPSMDRIKGIDGSGIGGEGLLAGDMDLLGWEFDEDFHNFDPPRGHAAYLKYRAKGASVSFYTQICDKVNLRGLDHATLQPLFT